MKVNRNTEIAYLITWILSIVLLVLFFILSFTINNCFDVFWGLASIFIGLWSAFFIAWIVEKQNNKDEINRIERIRPYYTNKLNEKILYLLKFITGPAETYDGKLKPYFINNKLDFNNLKWNANFIFQIKFLIIKNKLVNYEKSINTSKDTYYTISGSENVEFANLILEEIKAIADICNILSHIMKEQNIFNKKEIFSEKDISVTEEISKKYQQDTAESKLLGYDMYDDFFNALKDYIDQFNVETNEDSLQIDVDSILESLKEIPKIHEKFYNNHKKIRETALEYIEKNMFDEDKDKSQ